MKNKRIVLTLILAVSVIGLTACSNSESGSEIIDNSRENAHVYKDAVSISENNKSENDSDLLLTEEEKRLEDEAIKLYKESLIKKAQPTGILCLKEMKHINTGVKTDLYQIRNTKKAAEILLLKKSNRYVPKMIISLML